MASFEQDLIIFEDDTLLLQYTFTDLETTFNSSWGAWWGAYPKLSWPPLDGTYPTHAKHTNMVVNGGTLNATGDISLVSGDTIVRVFFDQSNFTEAASGPSGSLTTDTEYYTELVVTDTDNENRSIVAATGLLYISASMFSIAGYRP